MKAPTSSELSNVPITVKLFLENLFSNARRLQEVTVIESYECLLEKAHSQDRYSRITIPFFPNRVLLQDFTGLSVLQDLAGLSEILIERECQGMLDLKVSTKLIIDHSLNVEFSADREARNKNVLLQYRLNTERFRFIKWAERVFSNLTVIPPDSGIMHQLNLEELSPIICPNDRTGGFVLDSVLGTDSHTPMIGALGILGMACGGLEAEAVLLGHPFKVSISEFIGVHFVGSRQRGVCAADIALSLSGLLRSMEVQGAIIEAFGESVRQLSVPDRATISNMTPEYGAIAFQFVPDNETLKYIQLTRPKLDIGRLHKHLVTNGFFCDYETPYPQYSRVIEFDLSSVSIGVNGPTLPFVRRPLNECCGIVVHASITGCLNTSNQEEMIVAALFARNAVIKGLRVPDYVHTSFSPGSPSTTKILENAGLLCYLEALGFNVVGYGCGSCSGNTKGLKQLDIADLEVTGDLFAVTSGNRNFPGRLHPYIDKTYLCSPVLVIAYALAGRIEQGINEKIFGFDSSSMPITIDDLMPDVLEAQQIIMDAMNSEVFQREAKETLSQVMWDNIETSSGQVYNWLEAGQLSRPQMYHLTSEMPRVGRHNFRILLVLGDDISTDFISPVGKIPIKSEAGRFLLDRGVKQDSLGTFGMWRGNEEVMMRGAFTSQHLVNQAPDVETGEVRHFPSRFTGTAYGISRIYKTESTPLAIFAGARYGCGSSRDWAARATYLLGVRLVCAVNFEEIHRRNLISLGILPLVYANCSAVGDLCLIGDEEVSIAYPDILDIDHNVEVHLIGIGGRRSIDCSVAVYSSTELAILETGGIPGMIYTSHYTEL